MTPYQQLDFTLNALLGFTQLDAHTHGKTSWITALPPGVVSTDSFDRVTCPNYACAGVLNPAHRRRQDGDRAARTAEGRIMTPAQAKHLRALIADQVDAEREDAAAQIGGDTENCNVTGSERTLAARRVVEYIDQLTDQTAQQVGVKATIIIGAESAYACIATATTSLDVRLSPGRSADSSLRVSASEMRDKADRLLRRAGLIEQAAELLTK